MGTSPGRNAPGFVTEYVVHDRQVVWRQVPNDVDITLE